MNVIKSWARKPHTPWAKVLGKNDWFFSWFKNITDKLDFTFPVMLFFIGSAIIGFRFFKLRNLPKENIVCAVLFCLPLFANIVYWFLMAPDLRFAGATFWSMGIALVCLSIYDLVHWEKFVVLLGIAIVVLVLVRQERHFIKYLIQGDRQKAYDKFVPLISNGESGWFLPVPEPDLVRFEENSLIELYTPESGRQTWYGTSNMDRICTPQPRVDLNWIDPENKLRGFKRELLKEGGEN